MKVSYFVMIVLSTQRFAWCTNSLHRSSNNCASLSNKFGEFYFIFKLGISGLPRQVVTEIADRIRGWVVSQSVQRLNCDQQSSWDIWCYRMSMILHKSFSGIWSYTSNDASESSKPSLGEKRELWWYKVNLQRFAQLSGHLYFQRLALVLWWLCSEVFLWFVNYLCLVNCCNLSRFD